MENQGYDAPLHTIQHWLKVLEMTRNNYKTNVCSSV